MQGSRESQLAKGQGTVLADATSPTGGALLLVRLWPAAEEGETDEHFWESATPAVGLTLDLIAASEGVRAATLGRVIAATAPSVESAIATARRLQWAIQGFAEGEGMKETAAAALIHGGTELPDPLADSEWVAALQKANPGQILLTGEACEAVAQVPGYSLAAAVAGSPRELAWRRPQSKTDRGEDEQTLNRLIELSGNRVEEDEVPAPAPSALAPRAKVEDVAIAEETPRSSRKGMMIAAAIVVVLGVGALAVYLKKPAQTPAASVPTATAPAQAVPSANAPPSVTSQNSGATPARTSPATLPAGEQNLSPKELRAQKREQKKEAQQAGAQGAAAPAASEAADGHASQKPVGGRCEIEGAVPGVLESADHSLAAGKYRDAERKYGEVLACEPGNAHAREGYDKAKRSQQMESDQPE